MKVYSKDDIVNILHDSKCISSCSLINPRSNSISFIRGLQYLSVVENIREDIYLIAPLDVASEIKNNRIKVLPHADNVDETFVDIHNQINKNSDPKDNIISSDARINSTAVIGPDGNKIVERADGTIVRMKHMGNVVVKSGVSIDALAVIHRASIDSTIIGEDTTICSHVNIGHNCIIGKKNFIAPGVKVAGSVSIGDGCKIWQGSMLKNGIKICDNVTIGMGSIVTRDISEPGTYFGSPCRLRSRYE